MRPMKRIICILAVAALVVGAPQKVVAQERGELSVRGGVGWYSTPDFIGALASGLGTMSGEDGTVHQSFVPLLNPNIGLYYGVNDWLSLGGSATLGYSTARRVFEGSGVVEKSVEVIYPSLIVAAQTKYYTEGKFSIYGTWGLGAMAFISEQFYDGSVESDFNVSIMADVYPLSFSYGGDLGGFLEVGWGSRGFVNIGVYRNF